MNKIVLLRGKAVASVQAEVRAENHKTMMPASNTADVPRPVRVAIWRRNPVDRRLECRWVDAGRLDEGVSRDIRRRLAA